MVSRVEIEGLFTEHLQWSPVGGLSGEFSFSPDEGQYLRVFSSDTKLRQDGLILLGSIGVVMRDNSSTNFRSLFAYISNFEGFIEVPVLISMPQAIEWVNKIASSVLSIPSTPSKLLALLEAGYVGPFDAKTFIISSPGATEFIWSLKDR
jgi:hypothetical protein